VAIPKQLIDRKQWLVWRLEKDAERPEKTKLLKVPYYVDGGKRSGDQGDERDRRRLAVYAAALKAHPPEGREVGCGGLGFAFLPGDGLFGVDLDNVIDEDGVIDRNAVEIVKRCESFTEISPSGRGLHIYLAHPADVAPEINKSGDVDIYCGAQYFTVTGNHYAGTPLEVREISHSALAWLNGLINQIKDKKKRARAKLSVVDGGREEKQAVAGAATRGWDKSSGKSSSDDFARVNDAAMQNLNAWVPALLPAARAYLDGYRVSSRDLGRELEEDLSILPKGIVDWGLNDMGDAREGRRTPIDLVLEWNASTKKPAEALHWLAGQLNVELERPRAPKRDKRSEPAGDGPPGDTPPAEGRDGGRRDEDRRPVIKWVQENLPDVVDEAEDALITSGLRIYQRADMLVRVVRRDTPSVRHYKRWQPGSLGITVVDDAYLIEAMTRAARWRKWNAKAKERPGDPECPPGTWVPIMAPERVATTYLARRGHWQVPRLWSAISSPTLRPDGTVLQKPGYDVDTQTWYDPCGIEFPEIPESPTRDDADAAFKVFADAFKTFPFDREVDRSVALALALTALVRRSLETAPLGGISATTPSSGKTLLADGINILATGVSAPAIKLAETDEEFAKVMLAVLADGNPLVLIDNVTRPLDSDTLCVVLTSEYYRARVLGRTEMMSVPTTTLFLATGNNLVVTGDMRTRALICRLDPKVEHPEQRQFDVVFREWMTRERPKLVAAGLTVMRAFITTGQRPREQCEQWGRFEKWSDMVRAPLIWMGCQDPNDSLAELAKEDPERVELLRFLSVWEQNFGADGHTAAEAIARATHDLSFGLSTEAKALHELLVEICKDRDGKFNTRRLASWLGKRVGRIAEGRRIARGPGKDHTLTWKVEAVK
jgi:hypothetical protein